MESPELGERGLVMKSPAPQGARPNKYRDARVQMPGAAACQEARGLEVGGGWGLKIALAFGDDQGGRSVADDIGDGSRFAHEFIHCK